MSPVRARQQALDLQEEVEREDHGDGTLPFPPTMTLRPNQEIQRAFDDDIPYYHRSAQGIVYRGRILPPPGWSDNPLFRTAWTTGASFRDAHGALIVRIRSWFIKHGDPIERTHRDFSMRPQLLVHLHDAVRRIWLDKINQQEVSLVHPVRPTPMADPDGSRLLHIIIEVSRPALCTSHPMLLAVRQISAHGVADQVQWIPTLLPHPFTTEEVLRVAQVPCELHQLLVPLAGRIRRWMNPYHQRDALPGLFLPVWWDLRLRPFQHQPYGDEQNLLQQVAKLKTISSRLTDQGEATDPDIEVCQQGDEVRAQPHVPPRLFDDIAASAFHQNFGILVANGANPQRGVQAETFGLHVQHIGQRTIVLRDFEASTILHEIRRVWMDVRHPFKAILANPPPEDSTQIVFIVEFQDAHRPPIPGTTPVIQRVFDQEEVGTRTRAAYHIGAVNPYLLLGQVPLRHRCEPWGPLRCTVRRNGEIVLPLAQPALTEGDWLDFFVYPNRAPDDDDEALQLMQTRASSRTPRRTPTSQDTTEGTVMAHVFHMSTEHRLVVLDRTKPLTFVDQIAEIWVLPPHVRVSELHQVLQLPADLESTADATFLVEMTADRGRQALPTDQLILFDLFIADAGSLATPSHIRKVLWARKSMQRSSFLHLVASQAFCSSPDNSCTLSINNVVWPEDDEAPRQFVNGDYLRLHVAGPPSMPATDVQLVLCEQEMAEVHRYIFRSSPTPSPLPSPEPSEAGESEQGGEGDEVVEVVASSHDIIEITDDEDEIFVDADCQVEPTRYEKAMSPLKDITNISLPISSAKPVSRESVLVTDVDDKSWQECPSKTTLCLDELVPEKKHALITLRGIEELAKKCLENRTSLEIAIPSVDCMALEVLSQLDFCSYEDVKECPPEKFSIYTDGSKLWNDENLLTQSAWAFVVVAKWPDDPKEWVIGFQHGAVCVQPDHVSWIGATEQDSYQAEVVALIYATLWLCQEPLFYSGTPCELVADSTSALFGADGTFQIHHPTLSKVLRPLQRFASAFAPIQYRWQKAHAGEPHNELADHLAKCAARDKEPKYPSIPFQLSNDLLTLQWIWLSAERINDTNLPAVMSDGIEVPVPAPMQSKDIATEKEHDEGAMHLDLLITSFNVNSFKDAKASWSGRAELIRAQTVESGSVVNAWQETRRRQGGQWKSAHHFGFEAAAKGGAGGVALWFRHDIPFAVRTENEGSHPCYFQLNDFVVEVAEPELLIVRYHSPIWKAIFVSAHAPNDLAEDKVKNQFWQGIKKNLAKWVSEPVFLCIDANARLGTRMSAAVGAFAAEEETDNGFRFHDLLLQNRLFVPSTFEGMVDRPSDEQGTWLAKNGWKRIDYVALPQQLFDAVLRTWTTIFDKDVVKEDHRAVSLHLQVSLLLDKWKAPYAHPTLPIDRVAMQTPEGKAICSDILSYMSAQQPPWEVSADVQANFLNAAASQCLPQHFPQTKRKPKPTWIQQDTWDEFKVAKRWRNQLRSLRQLESAGLLRTIFRNWATSSKCEEDFSRWIRAVDVATAQALHQLKVTQSQRIKLLRRDEAAYFDVCANQRQDELTEAKGAQLWKCLKRDLPSFRRRTKRHLPFAIAHEQMHLHFAGIEEAEFRTLQDMCADSQWKSLQALQTTSAAKFEGDQMPTLFELEEAIRATPSGKASIGCIPIELLKANPPKAAQLLLPMMVSFFRFQQQPLSWKGGAYFPLFKGKGKMDDPASFRAILIGSVVPKLYHRIARKRLIKEVAPGLLPFQIGGVPRMTVSYAAHFLVALRQHAETSKRSTAVIFFDLKSAFYRAQRSTVVKDQLGYKEDCMDEDVALDTLTRPSALSDLNVNCCLQATIQEVFSGTWNTVKVACAHEQPIMQSTRGTRPGDPVADLTFTCVMQTILSRFLQEGEDLLPTLPDADGVQRVPPITWVDDVAIFLEDEQAELVIPKVQRTVALMYRLCRAYGLDLNFAPGKTEVLLRLHGRKSSQIRRQVFQ